MNAVQMLDQYAEQIDRRAAAVKIFERMEKEALMPVKEAMDTIAKERERALSVIDDEIVTTTEAIKAEMLGVNHQTIKGAKFQAVYYQGKPTWNGEMLRGFALAHPEVIGCLNTGEPYVAIKPVTKGNKEEA
jgi:hypothetical protein